MKLTKAGEMASEKIISRDEHNGLKTEVEAVLRVNGSIHITNIRQWKHEIDGEVEDARAALARDTEQSR